MRQLSLADRAKSVIAMYWGNENLSTAADDLGVSQQSLHGVVAGKVTEPRNWFFDAMSDGLDISSDWLRRGVGKGPEPFDQNGRPVVSGVPTWRRAVRAIELPAELEEAVLDLPFGVWRAAAVMHGPKLDGSSPSAASLSLSIRGWAAQINAMREELGAKAVAKRLLAHRLELSFGFSSSALRLIEMGAINKSVLATLDRSASKG